MDSAVVVAFQSRSSLYIIRQDNGDIKGPYKV
jgi:hypothetical protein